MDIATIAPQPFPKIVPDHCDCIVNTVTWFREFSESSTIAAIVAFVIDFLTGIVLLVSIVGWPLLWVIGTEVTRQKDTPKAQAVFEQNRTNLVQQFFYRQNGDIFGHMGSFISLGDLQSIALTSRSFYTVVRDNVLLKKDKDWFIEKGFKIVDRGKTLNQHVNAFTFLDQNWHLPPALIEELGGIIKVYELPVVHQEIETLNQNWPLRERAIIKVFDPNAEKYCIAFRYNAVGFTDTEFFVVEVYQTDNQGSISGLVAYPANIGVNWAEFPLEHFLKRLKRVMKREPVGNILTMFLQVSVERNGAVRRRGDNTVIPFNVDHPFEANDPNFDLILKGNL